MNPAVSPVETRSSPTATTPRCTRGSEIVGEQRWGGHAELRGRAGPQRGARARPAGRGRSAPRSRWPRSPPGGCCAGPGCGRARPCSSSGSAAGCRRPPSPWPAGSAPRSTSRPATPPSAGAAVELGAAGAFDSGEDWPVQARRGGRERRAGHLGPVDRGAAARRSAGGVRRHVGPDRASCRPATAVLQAARDHRVDHGRLRRVRRRAPRSWPRASRWRSTTSSTLADYPTALERLESGDQLGKIVLAPPVVGPAATGPGALGRPGQREGPTLSHGRARRRQGPARARGRPARRRADRCVAPDPRPPRAGVRGALRPRPAHRRPRGRAALAVQRGAYGLDTAFAARAGTSGPTIAVLCEYDALPGHRPRLRPQHHRHRRRSAPGSPRPRWPRSSAAGC